ncbi:hypothetical protein CNMCM8689_000251 [Aspergillus fumigatus]|nr:hypothetical protein CNMCM8057_006258 [Aspergillus fumigatus]KAF4253116.1 hypothetical protein CNMCM8714_006723 [Aspergillus fumigatus]KAF4281710.1 hypothetical protein CNMCM8689_000251 [Aspergillus fumigatus]KAF4284096.1 hypothetical protein CNMCM8686_005556 [Aspergillus fumigatus]
MVISSPESSSRCTGNSTGASSGLIALASPRLITCSLLIRNNKSRRLPVHLRVLLVGRQPRRLQELLRGTLQPTSLTLACGGGRAGVGSALLV